MSIPKLTEFFILITFFDEYGFSMFLYKPVEDSRGPFFSMKIIEFRRPFSFRLTNMIIKQWIFQPHNHSNQIHPIKHKFLNLIINLIMRRFPQELNNQIDKFRIGVSLSE